MATGIPIQVKMDVYESPGRHRYEPTGQLTEVEVTDRLKIKVGILEIDLNDIGFGKVLLDGKSTPICGATIVIKVGELPKVLLDVSLNHHPQSEAEEPLIVE